MIARGTDRYTIIEKIGEGGMGEVYKARDTLLGRQVALKFLSRSRPIDAGRRQRFVQEAKAASALNHPGVVAIHDLLQVEGRDVIVMEYVEGETLEQRLSRRRAGFGEALGYAIRIADALALAHHAGIVHRDLKPGNIMLTPDGEVKVLDFGLAKLTEPAWPDPDAATITSEKQSLTETRVILGTLLYMSPEQASGRPVDARSDIFSFGVVLYEMLTGRHPFRQATSAETLQAILHPDPAPPSGHVPSLPPEIDRVVLRSLRGEPRQRWQSLSDLKAVLEDPKHDSESGRKVVPARAGRRFLRPLWMAGALLVAASVLIPAVLRLRPGPPAERPLALSRLTYDGGLAAMPALSSDGKLVAYSSDRGGEDQVDIWVRYINQRGLVRLTRDPADDWMPFFSPDGSRLVFHSYRDGGGIYLVDTLGGEPRRIASGGIFPRFSPDGSQIVFLDDPYWAPGTLRRMFLVSPDGGRARPFAPAFGADAPPMSIGPIWSPDGKRVLFSGAPLDRPGDSDWWIADVDGGEPYSSGAGSALPRMDVMQYPCAWLPGRILFAAGTTFEGLNLHSASISPEGMISGPLRTLTTGPGLSLVPSVAADGSIAMARIEWQSNLWQVELDPETGRARSEPRKIETPPSPKFSISLARGGSLLAYSAFSGPAGNRRSDVRIQDLSTSRDTLYVSSRQELISLRPRLSPDGATVTWTDVVDGRRVTLAAPAGKPSERRTVCDGCVIRGFTSDGSGALVQTEPRRLDLLRLSDGGSTTLLDLDEGAVLGTDLSPDDRWLAVWTGHEDGSVAVHVLPGAEGPVSMDRGISISDGGMWVSDPQWSADGRFLYYLSNRDDFNCIWAVPIDPRTGRITGEPFAVVHAHRSEMKMQIPRRSFYMLTVDGSRLVFTAAEGSGEVYTATLHDFED